MVPHLCYAIIRTLSHICHFQVAYKPYLYASIILVIIWLLLFCWGHWFGRFFHETKKVEIECAALPQSFDGYKIVHISDLHLDGWQGEQEKLLTIVNEINALDADLIVFTGDLVSLSLEELKPLVPVLSQLKAKQGVISIMGNHDYMPYDKRVSEKQRSANIAELQRMEREELGWNLLLNQNVILHHGSDSIAVIGCENMSMGVHAIIQRGKLTEAMKGTDQLYKIILTHDPTHWKGEILKLPRENMRGTLTLSGHTHSGQFRVMGFSAARFIYNEYDGLYTDQDQHLYVNIGLGGTMPMRVGATPEITLIKLKRRE